ncbi:hypothetical protein EYV94_20410 [Puteibacter caeruleilacunae]|nr:hypothetical protein EYV94_20410 [Puteibacter caeruleilacunae]
MNIQADKLELMKLILETNNPNIITAIKTLLKRDLDRDFWNNLSEVEKEDISLGLEDLEKGNVVDFDEFMKRFEE